MTSGRPNSTAVILLAAGNASRYGTIKQLVPINGEPMVRHAAITALTAGLSPVIVVTGAYASEVTAAVQGLDVTLADNAQWTSGMGSSLAVGANALAHHGPLPSSVMVLLADQPSIAPEELQHMQRLHARAPERILTAGNEEHRGPPCIFPIAFLHELARSSGPQGARAWLQSYAPIVDTFHLPTAFEDIDTVADYAAWLANHPSSAGQASKTR